MINKLKIASIQTRFSSNIINFKEDKNKFGVLFTFKILQKIQKGDELFNHRKTNPLLPYRY